MISSIHTDTHTQKRCAQYSLIFTIPLKELKAANISIQRNLSTGLGLQDLIDIPDYPHTKIVCKVIEEYNIVLIRSLSPTMTAAIKTSLLSKKVPYAILQI